MLCFGISLSRTFEIPKLILFLFIFSGVVCLFAVQCCGHTIYTGNNMGQKCEGDCGLWVLNEILKKTYAENLKKIMGAVWELPAK